MINDDVISFNKAIRDAAECASSTNGESFRDFKAAFLSYINNVPEQSPQSDHHYKAAAAYEPKPDPTKPCPITLAIGHREEVETKGMFVIDLLCEGLTVEQVNELAMAYGIDILDITGVHSTGENMAPDASVSLMTEILKERAA